MYIMPTTMGCSVRLLSGLDYVTAQELEKNIGGGITLCITNYEQKSSESKLKASGFILLADYANHAHGHRGNRCKLWAAFGPRSSKSVKITPDLVKTDVDKKLALAKKNEARYKKKLEAITAILLPKKKIRKK